VDAISNITDYGKMCFHDIDNKLRIIQPKSHTGGTFGDIKDLVKLLMSGKYIIVPVAMPRETYEGGKT
jgi:hypothetical protein